MSSNKSTLRRTVYINLIVRERLEAKGRDIVCTSITKRKKEQECISSSSSGGRNNGGILIIIVILLPAAAVPVAESKAAEGQIVAAAVDTAVAGVELAAAGTFAWGR